MDKNNTNNHQEENPLAISGFDSLFHWKKILEMKTYNIKELNNEINSLPNINKIEEEYENYKSSLSNIFVKSIIIFGISNMVAWKIKAKPIYIIPKIFFPATLTCGYTFYDINKTQKYYDETFREDFIVLEQNEKIRNIIIKENLNYGFSIKEILEKKNK